MSIALKSILSLALYNASSWGAGYGVPRRRRLAALTCYVSDGHSPLPDSGPMSVLTPSERIVFFASVNAAQGADRYLRAEGVFLRPQGGAGLPDCLRATVGVADDMARAADLLKAWIKEEGLA